MLLQSDSSDYTGDVFDLNKQLFEVGDSIDNIITNVAEIEYEKYLDSQKAKYVIEEIYQLLSLTSKFQFTDADMRQELKFNIFSKNPWKDDEESEPVAPINDNWMRTNVHISTEVCLARDHEASKSMIQSEIF